MTKPLDYLYNSNYVSAAQKTVLRQQAIEMGLLPREAQAPSQEGQITTYGYLFLEVRKKVLVKFFQERNLVHHRLEFHYNEDMSLCLVEGPILENELQLFQYQHKSLYDICHSCN